jgi:FkbM family methyltransferase
MSMTKVFRDQVEFLSGFMGLKSRFLAFLNNFLFTLPVHYLKAEKLVSPLIRREFRVNVKFQGMKFLLRFPSADFSALNETCHKGIYDKFGEAKGVVMDIGAHIGTFTVKHGLGKGNVLYSVEPAPSNRELLRRNIEKNGLKNVEVIDWAISDRKGKAKFYISSISSVNPSLYSKTDSSINVDVMTLDETMKKMKINRLDFVKIDVEGAEMGVLRGGMKTLKKFRPKMAIETDYELGEMVALLKSIGYKKFNFGSSYGGMSRPNVLYCS